MITVFSSDTGEPSLLELRLSGCRWWYTRGPISSKVKAEILNQTLLSEFHLSAVACIHGHTHTEMFPSMHSKRETTSWDFVIVIKGNLRNKSSRHCLLDYEHTSTHTHTGVQKKKVEQWMTFFRMGFHTMDLWQFLKMDWIVTATGEWSSWHLDGRM